MRDKSLATVIGLGIIIFVVMFRVTGGFAATPVASSDVTVRTTAPTVNDDISVGLLPGFIWIDDSVPDVYILTDATDGAAVWTQLD